MLLKLSLSSRLEGSPKGVREFAKIGDGNGGTGGNGKNKSNDVRTREFLPSFLPKSIKEIAAVAACDF